MHDIQPKEMNTTNPAARAAPSGFGRAALASLGVVVLLASLMGLRTLDRRAYLGMAIHGHRVAVVDAGGPAAQAGFLAGDEIVSVDDVPTRDALHGDVALRRVIAGAPSTWEVERESGSATLEFPLAAPSPSEILWRGILTLTGIAFILVGLTVVLRRSDRVARLFGLLCFVFGFFIREPVEIISPPAYLVYTALYSLAILLMPALLVHFTLLFPAEKPLLRRHPQLPWIGYGIALFLYLVSFFFQIATATMPVDFAPHFAVLDVVSTIFFAIAVVAAIALFVHSHHVATRPARQRLLMPLWGTLLGMLPFTAITLGHVIRPGWSLPGDRYVVLATVLVPLSFAYAIVRHGVFDLSHLARRTVVGFSLLGMVAVIYVVLTYAFGGALHSVFPQPGFVLGLVSALLVALVAVLTWARLQRLVDRLLFPDRVAERSTIREMSRAVATCIDEAELLKLLAGKLPAALGASCGVALLWEEELGRFDLAYAYGIDVLTLGEVNLGRGLAKAFRDSSAPLLIEEIGSDLPFGFLPAEERRSLAHLGAEAVLPIRSENRLHGLVIFGGRKDGRRFGPEDIEMLDTFAALAGTAAENASLHGSLVKQERIARELELAREIQEHMLPREDPVLATVEIAGRTMPCFEVGGDYYDYVLLGRRRLGLVIGDAAGKGVPAALLMANVQAALRAEAERGTSPAALLRQLNRRVLGVDEPGRFVSLCFGYLDLAEPSFYYASAGHDPPVLVRADGSAERLDTTGLLLGVARGTEYGETRVDLSPGDLLLFYTDGVVDRMRGPEPFGEERLVEILTDARRLCAREVRERVLDAVANFSEADPPDDFTVVAVKIL